MLLRWRPLAIGTGDPNDPPRELRATGDGQYCGKPQINQFTLYLLYIFYMHGEEIVGTNDGISHIGHYAAHILCRQLLRLVL